MFRGREGETLAVQLRSVSGGDWAGSAPSVWVYPSGIEPYLSAGTCVYRLHGGWVFHPTLADYNYAGIVSYQFVAEGMLTEMLHVPIIQEFFEAPKWDGAARLTRVQFMELTALHVISPADSGFVQTLMTQGDFIQLTDAVLRRLHQIFPSVF